MWTLVLTVLPVLASAQPRELDYKGYRVWINKAEAHGNIKVYRRGQNDRLYAGEGYRLIVVHLSFAADQAPPSAGEWLNKKNRGRIRRNEVTLRTAASDEHRPSSLKAESWKDWAPSDESIHFNKERTEAEKRVLFRVPDGFDWKNARLHLANQSLAVKLEKWF